jgi:hypothetical protein
MFCWNIFKSLILTFRKLVSLWAFIYHVEKVSCVLFFLLIFSVALLFFSLCCIVDLFFAEHQFAFMDKSVTGGVFNDFKEKYASRMKHLHCLFGSYSVVPEFNKIMDRFKTFSPSSQLTAALPSYQITSGEDLGQDPTTTGLPSSLTSGDLSSDGEGDTEGDVLSSITAAAAASSNQRRASNRVANSEKNEARKRWITLLSKIGGGARSGDGKLNYYDGLYLLEEALSLSTPFHTALQSGGSSAQTSNDIIAVENARTTLCDLVKVS